MPHPSQQKWGKGNPVDVLPWPDNVTDPILDGDFEGSVEGTDMHGEAFCFGDGVDEPGLLPFSATLS